MDNHFFVKQKFTFFNKFLNNSTALIFILLAAVLLRLPAIFQELPPYLFCDEGMFASEAFAMLQQDRMLTTQFKAGGLNIYIPLIVAKGIFIFNHNLFSYNNYGYTNFVVLGRIIYLLLINPLILIFIYLSAVELFQKKIIGLFASLAFLISPLALANSRMWYPDHYIGLFSAALFYFLIKNNKAPFKLLNYLWIGTFLALAISTKYTGLLLVPIAGIVLLINLFWPIYRSRSYTKADFQNLFKLLFIIPISTMAVLIIVNMSAITNTSQFISDFNFNIENYKRHGSLGWHGVIFYLFTLYYLSLGGVGFISIILGYREIYKHHPRLIFLFLTPVAFATYLGLSGLVLFRNMTIFLPLIFLIAGVGINCLYQYMSAGSKKQKIFAVLVLTGIVFSQIPQLALTIKRDFDIDSRVLAEDWLKKNIPTTAMIGTNEFCAGPSPAKIAGFKTQIDPLMNNDLDYYVFDSYWASIFEPFYKGNKGVLQEWDQKYLHFYFLNDIDIFRWKSDSVQIASMVPPGYHLIKRFQSNGPDVLILKKN